MYPNVKSAPSIISITPVESRDAKIRRSRAYKHVRAREITLNAFNRFSRGSGKIAHDFLRLRNCAFLCPRSCAFYDRAIAIVFTFHYDGREQPFITNCAVECNLCRRLDDVHCSGRDFPTALLFRPIVSFASRTREKCSAGPRSALSTGHSNAGR